MRIFAVVVTFNRLSLLQRVIKDIKGQSIPLDRIIVVNNGSTDGTIGWLETQKGLTVINQDNLGGAGGFHTGIKYAFDDGADWIWSMDDDVFPDSDCLENLLRYKDYSLCMQPSRFFSDGIYVEWNKYFSLKAKRMFFYENYLKEKKEITFVNTCCFEGLLIHRSIVEKIGLPDQRFFISGDDTIYGFLASQYTNIGNIRDAVMIRAKKSTDNMFSPMYIYYSFRNFHLFQEYYCILFGKSKYPLRTRIREVLIGFYASCLLLINKQYKFKEKIQYINALRRGQMDSLRKSTGKSF